MTQKREGKAEIADIAAEIAALSALSPGDVQSVLVNLADVLPLFLSLGRSVSIVGLGSFRLWVSSGGAGSPEALNARGVKGVRLGFLPAPAVKRGLSRLSFDIEDTSADGSPA